jgi:hypothetical protein
VEAHRTILACSKARRGAAAALLAGFLSACASTNHWSLPEVLNILAGVKTEAELVARIGPPHGIARFNPGSRDDSYPFNRLSQEAWKRLLITSSAELVDTLPVGTRTLVYGFTYTPNMSGGGLLVYVSDKGEILGWSHSKSIDEKISRGRAYMYKRDFEK